MKTVRANKKIKKGLIDLVEVGETTDDVVSRILDDIEPVDRKKEKKINLNLSEETYDKLKSKQGENETLIQVLERAVDNATQG